MSILALAKINESKLYFGSLNIKIYTLPIFILFNLDFQKIEFLNTYKFRLNTITYFSKHVYSG